MENGLNTKSFFFLFVVELKPNNVVYMMIVNTLISNENPQYTNLYMYYVITAMNKIILCINYIEMKIM